MHVLTRQDQEPEETALQTLSAELAVAARGDWQPECVAHAFTAPEEGTLALSMQGWLELDARRSALLQGRLPQTVEELEEAMAVFGLALPEEFSPEEAADVASALRRAVQGAFATAVQMEPPVPRGPAEGDGFGDWLTIYAFLVVQCGLTPETALAERVDRALALIAAHRHNQGWRVTGTPYALRDLPEGEEVSDV